jgi:hypothetical protein
MGPGGDVVVTHRDTHAGNRLRHILQRLERTADDLNPVLVVVVIGLALLDLSVFAALELPLR